MDSLEATEAMSVAVAVAPRVKLDDIKEAIAEVHYLTGDELLTPDGANYRWHPGPISSHPAAVLTVCLVVMRNGFTVIGKAAPASPDNFNRELGRKYAYEDAIRQIWPLMGFALRDRLAAGIV